MKFCGDCGLAVSEMPKALDREPSTEKSSLECPACRATNPPGAERCDCGHNLAGVRLPSAGAASTTRAVAVIERTARPSKSRNSAWTVSLNQMPVGALSEGSRIAIPVGIGAHTISISIPLNFPLGAGKLGLTVPVKGPEDFGMLFRVGPAGKTWPANQHSFCVTEKRRLEPEEIEAIAAAMQGSPLPPAQTAGSVPVAMADVSGAYRPPQGFPFRDVYWGTTAVFFAFYWLFRWLFPSWLPEALRGLGFRDALLPCGVCGAVGSGILFVKWKLSARQSGDS